MNDLHWLLDNDAESGYRAKMILLRDEGYTALLPNSFFLTHLANLL